MSNFLLIITLNGVLSRNFSIKKLAFDNNQLLQIHTVLTFTGKTLLLTTIVTRTAIILRCQVHRFHQVGRTGDNFWTGGMVTSRQSFMVIFLVPTRWEGQVIISGHEAWSHLDNYSW